jgi:hypothetical protein
MPPHVKSIKRIFFGKEMEKIPILIIIDKDYCYIICKIKLFSLTLEPFAIKKIMIVTGY